MASPTEDGPKSLICESDRGVPVGMSDLLPHLTQGGTNLVIPAAISVVEGRQRAAGRPGARPTKSER